MALTWFSLKENHSSGFFPDQRNCQDRLKLHATAWLSGAHSTFSEDNNNTCQYHGREVAMRV